MYTYRIEQAIRAAAVLHKDQRRKGVAKLPYITHLIAVAAIIRDYTTDEDTIISAYLHDTLEDTEYTEDELREDFGDNVLKIVKAVSEPTDTTMSWSDRKTAYREQLRKAPLEALMVSAADKIHNMRSAVEEYYDQHDRFMSDFGGSLDARVMVYQDIGNILNSRLKNDIISEFNHVYTEYKNFIFNVKEEDNV